MLKSLSMNTNSADILKNEKRFLVSDKVLYRKVKKIALQYTDEPHANLLADKIVLAEKMGVSTHGLHYFNYYVLPLLENQKINNSNIKIIGDLFVHSYGNGGLGFKNLEDVLDKASKMAKKKGLAIALLKNPGKIGALRVFCKSIMDKGQLIIMMKNTAKTQGIKETGAIIGTNPLCIGLPDSNFIYDSSTSTVATNRLRLIQKEGEIPQRHVGKNLNRAYTFDKTHYLFPFSHGHFWYKSFFLGIAIEAIAALAGGKTSHRVNTSQNKKRLDSEEGMFCLIIDKKAAIDYKNYLYETKLLFEDLKVSGLRIPGEKGMAGKKVEVLKRDWEFIDKKI